MYCLQSLSVHGDDRFILLICCRLVHADVETIAAIGLKARSILSRNFISADFEEMPSQSIGIM